MQDVEYKKKKDKLIDLSVGRHINDEAQYQQDKFDAFARAKKEKAKEVCVNQWSQAIQIKNNEEIVNRIFV